MSSAEHSLEALAPATRSLANVLRQAVSSGPGLSLISAVSVDGGPLPTPTGARGHVSINGGPPILVPQLQQAIPRTGGSPPHTYPGVTIYLLAFEGGLLAIGYVDMYENLALELELARQNGGTDADDT